MTNNYRQNEIRPSKTNSNDMSGMALGTMTLGRMTQCRMTLYKIIPGIFVRFANAIDFKLISVL